MISNPPSKITAASSNKNMGPLTRAQKRKIDCKNTPKVLRCVSWNLNGLASEGAEYSSVQGVCAILKQANADIIFLQEVVSPMLRTFPDLMPDYQIVPGKNGPSAYYFNAILFRKGILIVDKNEVIVFSRTTMARNMQVIKVQLGIVKIILINCHLETGFQYSEIRKLQLKEAFDLMQSYDSSFSIILAGDMNLRNNEPYEVCGSSCPIDVSDLWISLGGRKECRFTWDPSNNNNIELIGSCPYKFRFDRMYYKSTTPRHLVPCYFDIIGNEKVDDKLTHRSDHFGILVKFVLEGSLRLALWNSGVIKRLYKAP